ncbi:hypothetical protein KQI38_09265 [Tissierella carlieri]|uniref:hypothetical protein n=1 Tax=Tissierella carlieri TaxID=689904 RepID=UPI001C11998C|nr:hypothetical protein [Tissierella carlieri]MBU5312215.1 hypothetical protein [Tissierella carlieri]
MEANELFYPEINVAIGSYNFQKGIEIEVYSSKDSYFDWAKTRFTQHFRENIIINKEDKAMIELGYDGVFDEAFEGYVINPISEGSYVNEVILKDDMIHLEKTYITNTFLDATPQEILRFCLNKAGVSDVKISSKTYQKKKVVPIFKKNVISVIEEIHSIWKIQEEFYFSRGVFYWGEKPEQNKIYEFEYGINIISLERPGRVWELETVSAPFIKHSQKIIVRHPKISGEFETKKIVFTTNETGFIRTYIYF